MCKHEEKQCPRCRLAFECKAGNITQCQCFGISFTETEKILIEKQYSDCLCRGCLIDLKNGFSLQLKQVPLQKND